MNPDLQKTALKLLAYCHDQQWAGFEPYDALNSSFLAETPLLKSKLARLVLTQFLKRSPVNVRPMLRIPKTRNPKALGLFLSSLVQLSRAGISVDRMYANEVIRHLVALRSPDRPYWCWGYNFPWQTRTVIVPRWAPNLVCTTFVASGLLDLFEEQPEDEFLQMAVSSAEFLLSDLFWTGGEGICGFGYPLPDVRCQVHNANLLASALLSRVYRLTGQERFLQPALAVARYTVAQQRRDGGWVYGEAATQQWIDNFHTGFNLSALRALSLALATSEFDESIARGFDFYRSHFFLPDGAVRYFHNRTYPLDTHCVAQSIITLLDLGDIDATSVNLAENVYDWARRNMWNEKEGYFFYRILPYGTIRTSYMRWTQAWMLLALSKLLSRTAEISCESRSTTTEVMPC